MYMSDGKRARSYNFSLLDFFESFAGTHPRTLSLEPLFFFVDFSFLLSFPFFLEGEKRSEKKRHTNSVICCDQKVGDSEEPFISLNLGEGSPGFIPLGERLFPCFFLGPVPFHRKYRPALFLGDVTSL